MRLVFADTFYWAALVNPRDEWHQRVKAISHTLAQTRLITTDEVLIEFLNFFSSYGTYLKNSAVLRVRDIMQNSRTQVIPQTRGSFLAGLALYGQRIDKGYSLLHLNEYNAPA